MRALAVSALCAALIVILTSSSRSQAPHEVMVVNISDSVVRAGLSLTKLGVAEVGDQYAIGGTFHATKGKIPEKLSLKILTESGKSVKRIGRLQRALLGTYGFVVFMPREEGQIKLINIGK
ncbi:MAG: hypothetical protein FJX76_13120 [Armatimonadetes bacterium]|nr:hypothetical protein [Armatimonadota bacterium]